MSATASDLHVNSPLTNIAVGAVQDTRNFIATRVFPVVPVMKESDIFRTFNIEDFYRDELKPRAEGTESHGTFYNVGEDSYICKSYDLHEDISDRKRRNADSVFNLDRTTTLSLTNKAMIRRDSLFVDAYMQQGVWALEFEGVASGEAGTQFRRWNDDAADPVEDVLAWKTQVLLASGKEPNKITLPWDVFTALKTNPAVIDRIKYSGGLGNDTPARVTENALAAVFEVDEVIVAKAIKNTAKEGEPMSGAFIASNSVLLSYAPQAPSLFDMSAGYIFSWSGLVGSQDGMRIKKFRMEQLESDRVEIQTAWDMKKVSDGCAAFAYNVLRDPV